MSYLIAAPEILDSAATDLAGMAGTLNTANASAAARTTGLLAAAEDEVSAAIASLFSDHAAAYQAASAEAATFQQQFMGALTAAAEAYAGAEAAGVSQLGWLLGLFGGPGLPSAANVALIMGGSGIPIPPPDYVTNMFNLYVQPFFQNFVPQALFYPAGNYALYTGVKSLTLDVSQAQGVQILDSAILQQLAAGNDVVVKGQSQSSTISSMVMPLLAAQGVPSTAHLSFVLTGDPNNPNGGLFARMAGLRIPALGITFNGATPDNLYTTTIWTQEYDGFADVPRYPINLLSDLNSLAGIYYVHSSYADLSHAQVSSAIQLPTSGPTMTTYNMIPTAHLPLLEPLRSIPLVGTPFADLLEPDLRVLVNLGYGDPNYGWSQGPANVSTPFGLFPSLSDMEKVPPLLSLGTQHGISDFIHDFSTTGSVASSVSSLSVWGPPSVPSATTLATPADLLSAVSPVSLANGLSNTINTLSAAASDTYQILLPTADVANGLLTSLPAYDLTLFANGLQSGDLISAIGQPIATDTYLIPLAGAFEAFAVVSQLQSVFDDLGHLIPS